MPYMALYLTKKSSMSQVLILLYDNGNVIKVQKIISSFFNSLNSDNIAQNLPDTLYSEIKNEITFRL